MRNWELYEKAGQLARCRNDEWFYDSDCPALGLEGEEGEVSDCLRRCCCDHYR